MPFWIEFAIKGTVKGMTNTLSNWIIEVMIESDFFVRIVLNGLSAVPGDFLLDQGIVFSCFNG